VDVFNPANIIRQRLTAVLEPSERILYVLTMCVRSKAYDQQPQILLCRFLCPSVHGNQRKRNFYRVGLLGHAGGIYHINVLRLISWASCAHVSSSCLLFGTVVATYAYLAHVHMRHSQSSHMSAHLDLSSNGGLMGTRLSLGCILRRSCNIALATLA
jgi:hypothetical protein